MSKHIVFISGNYPSTKKPYRGTFVRNLVREISKNDIKCTVISPTKNIINGDSIIT